jgi:GntR family transcriptional regulator
MKLGTLVLSTAEENAMKVDRSESLAVFEQVAGEIRRAILDGEAKPGERLPPAKDLAAEMGVNTNTVLRALRVLREEGLLEFKRGRGVSVSGTPERTAVLEKARELMEVSRRHGYRREEVLRLIESLP